MINEEMSRKLQRLLRECYECYTLEDIVNNIKAGRMQSFVVNDSWAVTQILDFPGCRILECFLVVGRLQDILALDHKLTEFAMEIGAKVIRAYGRNGFEETAKQAGWKSGARVFSKEIAYEHGQTTGLHYAN